MTLPTFPIMLAYEDADNILVIKPFRSVTDMNRWLRGRAVHPLWWETGGQRMSFARHAESA